MITFWMLFSVLNLVTLDDVQRDSKWIAGADWMKQDIDDAVRTGILTPVADLRLSTKEVIDDFHDGCVYDEVPEVLTRGHVLNQRRISLIQERASFSQYLLLQTKFNFRRNVFSFVHKLLSAVRKRKAQPQQQSLYEGTAKFSVFSVVSSSDPDNQAAETGSGLEACLQVYYYFAEFTAAHSPPGCFALTQMGNATAAELTDQFINMSLTYLYRKSSAEVIKFYSKKTVEKISVVQDRILFSKNRIFDGIAFAAEMGDLELTDLPAMDVKPHVPVIDRHSPLAYSTAQHIHWNVSHHKGIESCNRISFQQCSIMQGMTLYKELAEECLWFAEKSKKLIEISMGPISDHQLSIAPAFWCSQVDLFGPIICYVPGYERNMRNIKPSKVKTWILTYVCVVTKLVNAQVLEKTDAGGVLDGLTRLGCEVGLPSILLIDQDSTLLDFLLLSAFWDALPLVRAYTGMCAIPCH